MSGHLLMRLLDGLVWLTLGIIILVKLRSIVDWVICRGKKRERRKRMIRDIRAVIDQMSPEELAKERRRMRARCARERARGSEGVRMLTYRLRMVEARMQQIAAEAAKKTPEAIGRQ